MRTNSESILGVTAPGDAQDFTRSIAITSSIYPEQEIHIVPANLGVNPSLTITALAERTMSRLPAKAPVREEVAR